MARLFIIIISLSYIFASCTDRNIIFFETHHIPQKSWKAKDTVSFNIFIEDISSHYNIYLDIRNAGNYPYSNLYLFATTLMPDGKINTDTIENILADETGKWYGKGLGDIKDNRYLLRKGAKFPLKGNYTFRFVQAMRTDDLKGISDIGLRIEKE
jgi:gliding motility-associated lipoprotein GldH